MAIRFWTDDAMVVGDCPCGGRLRLVEDPGPTVPVEAQCEACSALTGVPHATVGAAAREPVQNGLQQDWGF